MHVAFTTVTQPPDVFLPVLEGTRRDCDGAQGCQMEDDPENRDNTLQEGLGFVLYFSEWIYCRKDKNVLSCTWIVLTQSCHRQMYISWSHSSFFFSFLPPSSTPHLSSTLHVHRLHRRRQRGAVFQPALPAFSIVRYTPSATKLSLTVYSFLQFMQVFPLFFSRHHPHSSLLLFISFKH